MSAALLFIGVKWFIMFVVAVIGILTFAIGGTIGEFEVKRGNGAFGLVFALLLWFVATIAVLVFQYVRGL